MATNPGLRILRVDLSAEHLSVEELDARRYRATMGGGGLAAELALRLGAAEADPWAADNVLVFAGGVLTGIEAPGCAKHAVLAKSPLTLGVGESQSEGFWGPELKRAGFTNIAESLAPNR